MQRAAERRRAMSRKRAARTRREPAPRKEPATARRDVDETAVASAVEPDEPAEAPASGRPESDETNVAPDLVDVPPRPTRPAALDGSGIGDEESDPADLDGAAGR